MRLTDNERGGALLMVLLLVVIFTVLGVGMLSINTSASKQFEKKENQVQARHQAEMGVLHYKAEVTKMIEQHNENIQSVTNAVDLTKLNNDFCSELASKKTTEVTDEEYRVSLQNKLGVDEFGCTYGEGKTIKLTINSIGIPGSDSEAEIDADLIITLPEVEFIVIGDHNNDGNSGNGSEAPPNVPTEDVKKVVGKMFIKNGPYIQDEASLYITGNLEVEPGKNKGGTDATIQKDLFVEKILDIHNQGCIAVQGDFTAKEKINLGNKAYLFIYGNANLPNNITLHNNHAEIFISGHVYINGKKQNPKKYREVPQTHDECRPPGLPPSNPEFQFFEWDLNEKIEAIYR